MAELIYGVSDGKKWIAGQIPLKKDVVAHIDSRTGKGYDAVVESMAETIDWQASKMTLPSADQEDIRQELTMIAIAAIPDYNTERAANLCTFLQNHLQRRAKNLYKFATEQRRTALARPDRPSKLHCPKCGFLHLVDGASQEHLICARCGEEEGPKRWRRYPLLIATFSSSQSLPIEAEDGEPSSIEDFCTYSDLWFLGAQAEGEVMENKIALEEVSGREDADTKLIIQHLLEGWSLSDACVKVGASRTIVKKRLRAIRERI